jgi:hypothetical protein
MASRWDTCCADSFLAADPQRIAAVLDADKKG